MVESSHFESVKVTKRSEEIVQMWAELKDVAKARQEVWKEALLLFKPSAFVMFHNLGKHFGTLWSSFLTRTNISQIVIHSDSSMQVNILK